MPDTENYIAYSSGLIIRDQADLATLCVFYDRVYLPYTQQDIGADIQGGNLLVNWKSSDQNNVVNWYRANLPLFRSGALARLDNPRGDGSEQFHAELRSSAPGDNEVYRVTWTVGPGNKISIDPAWRSMAGGFLAASDMMSHVKREDIAVPELLNSNDGPRVRELIIELQAKHIMSYLLPKLDSLAVDDILKLREAVAPTREGFALHMQKLSKGINERLKGGESLKEINRWAANLVLYDLIPDYREFRAQARAGSSLLDKLGRALEISASPWTPKFYGDLLRAFGVPVRNAAEQVERRSNKSRAFQFMQAVEESKVAKYQRRS